MIWIGEKPVANLSEEELAGIKLGPCPSCKAGNTSIRPQKDGWYYVGCIECFNKILCDRANLEYAIELWNRRAGLCTMAKNEL